MPAEASVEGCRLISCRGSVGPGLVRQPFSVARPAPSLSRRIRPDSLPLALSHPRKFSRFALLRRPVHASPSRTSSDHDFFALLSIALQTSEPNIVLV
jgi:hypothetical protein